MKEGRRNLPCSDAGGYDEATFSAVPLNLTIPPTCLRQATSPYTGEAIMRRLLPPREGGKGIRIYSLSPVADVRRTPCTVSRGGNRARSGNFPTMGNFQVRKWSKPHRGFDKKALAHPSRHLFCEAKEMRELYFKFSERNALIALSGT